MPLAVITAFAVSDSAVLCVDIKLGDAPEISMSHREVRGHRWPLRMTAPSPSDIVTVEDVYSAESPWSQRRPIDNKEPTHCGKMSTPRAAMGNDGMFRRPVWVDTAVLPSGKITVTGFLVTLTSSMICVSSREIKFPVVPVSAFSKTGVGGLPPPPTFFLFLPTPFPPPPFPPPVLGWSWRSDWIL